MNEQLNELRKKVHAKGFNISMMFNKYKKDQRNRKALYDLPDSVMIEVCKEYLTGREVKNNFPYFLKVLTLKSHEHFAAKHQKDAKSQAFSSNMPTHLSQLFNNS